MENSVKTIYFIGIKGVGMSALALMAKGMGYTVLGSDVAEEFITDSVLKEAGIQLLEGFKQEHITADIDLVVIGAAYGEDNPEVNEAHTKGITTLTYSELQAKLSEDKKTIAVAGTHGKTTTTSLLTYLLYKAHTKPSWIIGTGHVKGLPAHGGAGEGSYFVTEADDYKKAPNDPTPKFLDLSPFAAIVTSIEHDHPDLYPTLADCVEAFRRFMQRIAKDGFVIAYGDDDTVQSLLSEFSTLEVITYGFTDKDDCKIMTTEHADQFIIQCTNQEQIGPFHLALPGKHNMLNATAAILMARKLGLEVETIQEILPTFQTVERRFELLGKKDDVIVIDDYAHHPTAIQHTLEAAKQAYPDRPLYCLFQAHTYSRTKALLHEFATSFQPADTVIITDIFASAREKEATITSEAFFTEVKKQHDHAIYVPKTELLEYLKKNLPSNAVLITMGAGDIYKVGKEYLTAS